jgi:hypothetical protein
MSTSRWTCWAGPSQVERYTRRPPMQSRACTARVVRGEFDPSIPSVQGKERHRTRNPSRRCAGGSARSWAARPSAKTPKARPNHRSTRYLDSERLRRIEPACPARGAGTQCRSRIERRASASCGSVASQRWRLGAVAPTSWSGFLVRGGFGSAGGSRSCCSSRSLRTRWTPAIPAASGLSWSVDQPDAEPCSVPVTAMRPRLASGTCRGQTTDGAQRPIMDTPRPSDRFGRRLSRSADS